MKMGRILFTVLTFGLLILSGCEKPEDLLRTNLTNGTWKLEDHCDSHGFLNFKSDNTGSAWVNDECKTGSPCSNIYTFDWSISETKLTIHYNLKSSTLYCSQGSSSLVSANPSESMELGENPSNIYMSGERFNNANGGGTESASSSSSKCFIGTWKRQGLISPEVQEYSFSGNGTGWTSRMIVQGTSIVCRIKFYFTWKDNGNNTVHCTYTNITNDCGQNPALPSPEDIQVICNGSSLTVSGNTWRKI